MLPPSIYILCNLYDKEDLHYVLKGSLELERGVGEGLHSFIPVGDGNGYLKPDELLPY